MQGRLRQQLLSVEISTECARTGRAIGIGLDSELTYRLAENDATPLVFKPMVDFHELTDPSIIDAF